MRTTSERPGGRGMGRGRGLPPVGELQSVVDPDELDTSEELEGDEEEDEVVLASVGDGEGDDE